MANDEQSHQGGLGDMFRNDLIKNCLGLSPEARRALQHEGILTLEALMKEGEEGLTELWGKNSELLQEVREFLKSIDSLEDKPAPSDPNILPPHLLAVWGEANHSLTELVAERDELILKIEQNGQELQRIRSTEGGLLSGQGILRERIQSSLDTERVLRKIMKFLEDQCEPEPTDPAPEDPTDTSAQGKRCPECGVAPMTDDPDRFRCHTCGYVELKDDLVPVPGPISGLPRRPETISGTEALKRLDEALEEFDKELKKEDEEPDRGLAL